MDWCGDNKTLDAAGRAEGHLNFSRALNATGPSSRVGAANLLAYSDDDDDDDDDDVLDVLSSPARAGRMIQRAGRSDRVGSFACKSQIWRGRPPAPAGDVLSLPSWPCKAIGRSKQKGCFDTTLLPVARPSDGLRALPWAVREAPELGLRSAPRGALCPPSNLPNRLQECWMGGEYCRLQPAHSTLGSMTPSLPPTRDADKVSGALASSRQHRAALACGRRPPRLIQPHPRAARRHQGSRRWRGCHSAAAPPALPLVGVYQWRVRRGRQ